MIASTICPAPEARSGRRPRMQDCHQLFDPVSSTFTYVLADPVTRDAVMIDPVDSEFDAYSALLGREHLKLRYVVETHKR
jgi:glyoxylase-like metal-dependent hydrolase (beta-lactamase superfamily II)